MSALVLEVSIDRHKGEYYLVFQMAALQEVRHGPFRTVLGAMDALENFIWQLTHGRQRPWPLRFLWWVRVAMGRIPKTAI